MCVFNSDHSFFPPVSGFDLATAGLLVLNSDHSFFPPVSGLYLATAGLLVLGFLEVKVPAMCILIVVMVSLSSTIASGLIMPLDMAPRSVSQSLSPVVSEV